MENIENLMLNDAYWRPIEKRWHWDADEPDPWNDEPDEEYIHDDDDDPRYW